MDMKFGLVPAHSRFLTDRSGTLALEDMEQLRAMLRLFQKKFPQTLFSILITELESGMSVAEYAFWLANRAKFGGVDKALADNFNLLLLIDLAGNTAALTVGYGLEPYIQESDLQDVLDELARAMRSHDLAAGLRACIEFLTQRLRVLSAKAHSAPAPAAVPA
ncbi:MAG: TPM domain-containing protein [Verrucomicrobiota bacterium]|nr:TPM domain-containing protein [Verrucomicrobiota bacterium]